MSRQKKLAPMKTYNLRLPIQLKDQVNIMLLDPFTGKPKYGAFSGLIESLLREWLVSTNEPLNTEKSLPNSEAGGELP